MKKKWLIGLASAALAVTMAFGFAACGDDPAPQEPGPSQGTNPTPPGTTEKTDLEIAKEAIASLKEQYLEADEVTPFDYELWGRTKVGDNFYNITWTVSTEVSGVTIGNLVVVGAMDSNGNVPVAVTRTDQEVPYKLTASVTVGTTTQTFDFTRKLPATAEVHGSVTYKFDAVKYSDYTDNYAKLDAAKVLNILQTAGGTNHGIASVDVADYVYAGNQANQGGITKTDGYLKFGTGSYNGKLTITFTKAVNKVEIGAKGWTDSNESGDKIDTISVNGGTAQTPPVDYDGLLVFNVDPTMTITIETTKRAFIFGIGVSYAPEDAHVHVGDGNVTHLAGTWQHQEGCSAPNCTNGGKLPAADCTPVNNVCPDCHTTYTLEQIFERVEAGNTMKGTYEMTGVITTAPSTGTSGNVRFNINVTVGSETKEVSAYYVKAGTGIDKTALKVGDTVTIQGPLTLYSGETVQFNGGTITNYVDAAADMDNQQKADAALEELNLDAMTTEYYIVGDYELPKDVRESYGATVVWTVKTNANDHVAIKNNTTLSVNGLPATGEESIVLTVTVTVGSGNEAKQATQDVTIKLTPARAEMVFTPLANTPTAGTYYLAIKVQDGQYYYITGDMSGFYMATTTDSTKAVQVILTGDNTNGYTLKTTAGKFIEITVGEHINAVYQNAQTEGKVWKWDDTYHILTWEEGGKKYFLETYGSSTTIGAGAYDTYVTSPTTWKAVLGTLVEHTDAVKVKEVADAIEEPEKLEFFAADKDVEMTLTTETELSAKYHATITWTVSNELKTYITIADGKLTVTALPTDAAVTGKLIATVTIGEGDDAKTATHEFTVTLNKADETPKMFKAVEDVPADGDYYFAMSINGKLYYLTGQPSGNYLATSDDIKDAAQVTVSKSGDNYLLKVGAKFLEVNKVTNNSNTYYNAKINDAQTEGAVWTWNTQYKIFTMNIDGTAYYLGSYTNSKGTYTTVSASAISYAANDTSYLGRLGTLADMTEEDMANEVLASIELEQTTFTAENKTGIDLPTPDAYGATVEWDIEGTSTCVSLGGNKLLINSLPTDSDETVTLTVTVTVGEATVDKTISITVKAPATGPANDGTEAHPYTVAEVNAYLATLKLASDAYTDKPIYVKGYVCTGFNGWSGNYKNWQYVYLVDDIADISKTSDVTRFQAFKLYPDTTKHILELADDLFAGSEIVIYGYIQNYKGTTFEMTTKSDAPNPMASSYTDARDDAAKANAAIATAQKTLNALTLTEDVTDYVLPASTVTGVTLEYTGDNVQENKLTVAQNAEVQELTIRINATIGEAHGTEATATVTVAAKAPEVPEDATTVNWTAENYSKLLGWNSKSSYDTIKIDSNITIATDKGTNNNNGPTYNSNGLDLRLYLNNKITITASGNAQIISVKFTYTGNSGNGVLLASDETQIISGVVVSVNAASVTLTVGCSGNDSKGQPNTSGGQARITAIEIIYTDGVETTDEFYANMVKDVIEVDTKNTLKTDLLLPTVDHEKVELDWTIDDDANVGAAAKIEPAKEGTGKQITVTRQADDVTFTLKLTVKYNGASSEEKTFTLTVEKKPVELQPGVDAEVAKIEFQSGKFTGNNTSGYTGSTELTNEDGTTTWILEAFNNNNGSWSDFRTGRKSDSCVGKITTKEAMNYVITKIVVTTGSVTNDVVSSFKLLIADNSAFTGAKEVTATIAANAENTFTIPTEMQGLNMYYRIEFTCTAKSNGSVSVKSLSFTGHVPTDEEKSGAAAAAAISAPVADLPHHED